MKCLPPTFHPPPLSCNNRPHSSRGPTKVARVVSHGRKSNPHDTHPAPSKTDAQPPTICALTAPHGLCASTRWKREPAAAATATAYMAATRLKSAGWRASSPVVRETPRRERETLRTIVCSAEKYIPTVFNSTSSYTLICACLMPFCCCGHPPHRSPPSLLKCSRIRDAETKPHARPNDDCGDSPRSTMTLLASNLIPRLRDARCDLRLCRR